MKTRAILTCPLCGRTQPVEMSLDACQVRYQCQHCQTMLKPQPGDCCVFCSYADTRCPPMQAAGNF